MRNALVVLLVASFIFVGCGKAVKRVGVEEVIDLSGKWNDTDSRLVSEAMISDALSRPWLQTFKAGKPKPPVVIVGTVRNLSHEHINVMTFTKDLERELINSGQVQFVAAKDEREELREERKEQSVYASEETAKEFGKEVGADYMLKGTINTILDKIEGKEVIFYQVNLELLDMQSNMKVWIGEKKIKKFISRSRIKP